MMSQSSMSALELSWNVIRRRYTRFKHDMKQQKQSKYIRRKRKQARAVTQHFTSQSPSAKEIDFYMRSRDEEINTENLVLSNEDKSHIARNYHDGFYKI